MTTPSKRTLSQLTLGLSAALFIIGSVGMSFRVEPFYSWYYLFAWWPYIFMLESWLELRGATSVLFGNPRVFLLQLPMSVIIWLVFEVFNFRLGNWHYLNVPSSLPLRWFGYGLSFATVLPGILATTRVLDYLQLHSRARSTPFDNPQGLYQPLLFTGIVFLLLPMSFPKYYFPLVWGGFIFLLDPILHRYGGRSILSQLQRGSPRTLLLLCTAGLICGFLWECWNYLAGSKWYYTIPFVGSPKLFEMPVIGFIGFPPFAVECYVMANAFFLLRDRLWHVGREGKGMNPALLGLVALLFALVVFHGIDKYTVVSFR